MKKITRITLGFFAALTIFFIAVPTFAEVTGLISPGDNPENIDTNTAWGGNAKVAARMIVNYFLFFLGIVATIFVIYGGFLYVTSGGDDGGAEKGKKILMYAAIGIIIILISFALVTTLLGAGSNTDPGNML